MFSARDSRMKRLKAIAALGPSHDLRRAGGVFEQVSKPERPAVHLLGRVKQPVNRTGALQRVRISQERNHVTAGWNSPRQVQRHAAKKLGIVGKICRLDSLSAQGGKYVVINPRQAIHLRNGSSVGNGSQAAGNHLRARPGRTGKRRCRRAPSSENRRTRRRVLREVCKVGAPRRARLACSPPRRWIPLALGASQPENHSAM